MANHCWQGLNQLRVGNVSVLIILEKVIMVLICIAAHTQTHRDDFFAHSIFLLKRVNLIAIFSRENNKVIHFSGFNTTIKIFH